MSARHTRFTIAVGLALGATAAAAAPPPIGADDGPGPTPTADDPDRPSAGHVGECAVPNKTKCLSMVRVDGQPVPYLETPCGIAQREACRDHVGDALEAHGVAAAADASIPTLGMLRPRQTEMPSQLRDGKYFRYRAGKKLASQRTKYRKAYKKVDDLLAGMGGMSNAVPPLARGETTPVNEALAFWRNESWKNNGAEVRSCKEYAYARAFGAARFIDAASACRGDKECVFDVAYSNTREGIAGRSLFDEDGVKMARQLALPEGKFPKNDMFARGVKEFVRSNGRAGRLGDTDEIVGLEQALTQGQTWYEIDLCTGNACNGTRKFADVWAFHDAMHNINGTVGDAEAEEYERRRQEFRALLDQWMIAVGNERIPEQRTEQDLVLPLDMRAQDPFERYGHENDYVQRARDQRIQLEKKFGKQILDVSAPEALQRIRAAAAGPQGARAPAAIGLLAAPPPVTGGGSASKRPGAKPGAKARQVVSCSRPDDEWGLETMLQGPISCRIGKFLRAEWDRKLAGQRSCLDLGNPRCDWTMAMFEQTVLTQIPLLDAQVADEAFCDQYSDTDTFDDNPGDRAFVTAVAGRLQDNKDEVEDDLTEVADYLLDDGEIGRALGKTWAGGDYIGERDAFAAGYDYDIGWRVEPAQKVPSDAEQHAGLVCKVKASVHGDMSFDAYLMGKKFEVVSGSVRVRSRPNADGKAEVNAHLEMFDMSLYQPEGAGWKGTQSFAADPVPFHQISVPDVRPRFDVMVGPVPVSGMVWGELMFGSALDVDGTAGTSCDATKLTFRAHGEYTPFFMASGLGQVGVGIAGLVSAGVRASLVLAAIGAPLKFTANNSTKEGAQSVRFDSTMDLLLSTLGGRVALYLEFLLYEEEFELFRWRGLQHQVPLMKYVANVRARGLK